MSDYLTSIVAKTLAPATLRPRTRMLFEPESAGDTPLFAVEETPSARGEREIAARPAPAASAAHRRHQDQEQAVRGESRTDNARSAADVPIAVPAPGQPVPSSEIEIRHDDAPRSDLAPRVLVNETILEAPPRTIIETSDAPPQRERILREPRPPRERILREEAPPRERTRIERVTREAAVLIERDELPDPEQHAADAVPRPRAPREIKRAVHESQPRRMAAARPIEERGQTEPVINVSIGRIEVRAVPSAVAASQPRATAPRLTLDDYLGRRNGKTR